MPVWKRTSSTCTGRSGSPEEHGRTAITRSALSSETFGTIVPDESGDWTLALSCREVFARGGRAVDVSGPLLETEGLAVHDGFW